MKILPLCLSFALTLLMSYIGLGCGTDQPLNLNQGSANHGDPNHENPTDDTGFGDFDEADGAQGDAFVFEPDTDEDIADVAVDHPNHSLVETSDGPVWGRIDDANQVWSYRGIPYAAPPIGELRWKAPQPPATRSEPLFAKEFGPACPQNREILAGASLTWDEDCLFLNIWRPSEIDAPLPVMVWIHGGAFVSGGTNQHIGGHYLYDGTALAKEDVIVVTLNYRLGALGFLAHEAFESANFGLLDQLAALEWVKENIALFGGDPNQITLFGESAGAVSICTLMTSSRGHGLFHRAIMQSGYCPDKLPSLSQARTQGTRLAQAVGCGNAVDKAHCLRGKSVDDILEALEAPVDDLFDGEFYRPTLDGQLLSQNPAFVLGTGNGMDIPIIMGANADEGTVFMRPRSNLSEEGYEALIETNFSSMAEAILEEYPVEAYDFPWLAASDIIGDLVFVCPTRWAVEAHARHDRAAYHYHFTHVTVTGELFRIGAFHGSDIPFVFDTFGVYHPTAEEVAIGQMMRTFWLNFARGEEPGEVHGLSWPRYTLADDEGVEFADPSTIVSRWRAERCKFWRDTLGLN